MTAPIDSHYTAILAVLNAALPGAHKAYRLGDAAIVTDDSDAYTEVFISNRSGWVKRLGSPLGMGLMVASTRYVAKYAANAGVQYDKTRSALEGVVLSIGGGETTALEFRPGNAIAPDDGWFSGYDDWLYAL